MLSPAKHVVYAIAYKRKRLVKQVYTLAIHALLLAVLTACPPLLFRIIHKHQRMERWDNFDLRLNFKRCVLPTECMKGTNGGNYLGNGGWYAVSYWLKKSEVGSWKTEDGA